VSDFVVCPYDGINLKAVGRTLGLADHCRWGAQNAAGGSSWLTARLSNRRMRWRTTPGQDFRRDVLTCREAGEVVLSQLADVKVEAVSVAEGTVRIAARAQENASS
jgi:hypothetical protein